MVRVDKYADLDLNFMVGKKFVVSMVAIVAHLRYTCQTFCKKVFGASAMTQKEKPSSVSRGPKMEEKSRVSATTITNEVSV